MSAPISLADEMRAIRRGDVTVTPPKQTPEPGSSERPWKADLDRVQQTLQDVLQAVSQLSGVEFPGVGPDSPNGNGASLRLDAKTLKDRIRNDLEAFSANTAAEVAQHAQEQTRAALSTVQNEMSGQIDRMAGELRSKLQAGLEPAAVEADFTEQNRKRVAELVKTQTDEFARWVWLMCKGTGTTIPEQIASLLGPCVDEATDNFKGKFRQEVQQLLAEEEQAVRQRVQETMGSFESQISTLEQTAQQTCDRNADRVAQASEEKLKAGADEAVKSFEGRVRGETESSLGGFQARLEEMVAGSLDHSKGELKGFLDLQMDGAQKQIQELSRSTHESLSQDITRVTESLRGLDQELAGIRDKHIAASEQQLSSSIREAMESLKVSVRQIADAQLEEINTMLRESRENSAAEYEARLREASESRYNELLGRVEQKAGETGTRVATELRSTSESVMEELVNKVNASALALREETDKVTSRIESSIESSLENYRQQLTRITHDRLEEQRKQISGSVSDLHSRLRQVADLLMLDDPSR